MEPRISIITITFQAETYLKRTLDSVLGQSYTNMEYIIVDGASKDGTISMIKEYEALFKLRSISFRWVSEPDKGIYDAMNKGLQLATGDYVWFMNAGDKIPDSNSLHDIFENLSAHFTGQNGQQDFPDFIYGETDIVNEQGQILGHRRLKAPEVLNWKSFRMGMLVCHQSMLVKRSLAPMFDLQYKYSADFDWTIRCLRKAKSIHNTHLILADFLDGGVSKKKMKASLKERFHIMVRNYGLTGTILRHCWFACRAAWFKLFHGWI
ncbi:MAG: glycosyltransferase family 2 protein [Bacteroidales bacterium]|nr:glycosyltransferase family 2 protein [Bacteroidales bacterium]